MIHLILLFILIANPAFAEMPMDQIQTIDASTDSQILEACPQFTDTEIIEVPYNPNNYYTDNTPSVLFRSFIQERSRQNAIGQKKTAERMAIINADTPETVIKLYSVGGHQIETERILKTMESAKAQGKHLITHAYTKAVSASFFLLMAGTPNYRIVDNDTRIIAHTMRQKGTQRNTIRFVEDLPVNSEQYKTMTRNNQWARDLFVHYSTNGITAECAETIIAGKANVKISPEIALKAGWVDIVAFPEKSTALIRKNN